MSISRDLRVEQSLNDIKSFVAFFDFITNPQDYAAVVSEAKTVLDQMQKVVALYPTVEEAEAYLVQAKQKLFSAEQKAGEIVATAAKQKEDALAAVKDARDRLDADKDVYNEAVRQMQATASKLKEQIDLCAAKESELKALQASLNEKQDKLNKDTLELQKKADQIKSLLG